MTQITCPHCGDTYTYVDAAHLCSRGPYAPKPMPTMNERIRELAEQATSIQGPTPYNPLTFEVFDKEKFAELIVRECGDVAYRAFWADPDNVRGRHIEEQIRKHFGVEQ